MLNDGTAGINICTHPKPEEKTETSIRMGKVMQNKVAHCTRKKKEKKIMSRNSFS